MTYAVVENLVTSKKTKNVMDIDAVKPKMDRLTNEQI